MSLTLTLSTSLLALLAGRVPAPGRETPGELAADPKRQAMMLVIVQGVDAEAQTLHVLTLAPSVRQAYSWESRVIPPRRRGEGRDAHSQWMKDRWRTVGQGAGGAGRSGQKQKVKVRRVIWVPVTRWEEQSLSLQKLEFQDLKGNKLSYPEALQRLRPGQAALLQARSIPRGAETTAAVEGMLVLVPRDSGATGDAAKHKGE